MVQNKNQHYVPEFYFKLFSKDEKTICVFNISNKKFIEHASIKGQCSKHYFYSKNLNIEKTFSWLEGLAKKKLKNIIDNKNLSCLSKEEKEHLKSHILFQHGRTKFAYDREEDMANYIFNLLKPKIYQDAKESGEDISWKSIKNSKIVLKSSYNLLVSMMSGILLYDLNMILLENQSNMDFIFSDNPVVFFNSFFNKKSPYGTTGLASTGLQIFYPINSKLMLSLFDSNFYTLLNNDVIKIKDSKDIQRLNGLQVLNCNNNIYFEDKNFKDKVIERYKQLKSKIPKQKNEYEIMGCRIAEDGTRRELLRTSSPKIYYNLEKLSFLKHKKIDIDYGVRNIQLFKIHKKIIDAVIKGEIKSMSDLSLFIRKNKMKNKK